MAEIVVRAPRPEDAAAIARIWLDNATYYVELDPGAFRLPREDGLGEWIEALLAEPLRPNELALVAECDGEVAGSLEAAIVEPMADADRQFVAEVGERRLLVNNLGVHRRYWRRGVGRALMDAAEKWGREQGATLVCLDTYLGSAVSVPFYEELGYHRHSINFRKRI